MNGAQLNGKGHIVSSSMEQRPGTFTEGSQDEIVLSVRDLLEVLWRRLWMIALVAAVLAGSVVGFELLLPPTYQASIKILIGQEQLEEEIPFPADVVALQEITQTMAAAIDTRPVAEEAIQRLDLQNSPEDFLPEDLLEGLQVSQTNETQFIEVSYEDYSPEEAQRIVNTVGTVFSEQVSEISASTGAVTATVWEEAAVPESPVSPNPLRDGLLALVLGGMLGVGLALLLEHLDDSWRSPEEAEQISGVPTFGVIPEIKASKSVKSYGSRRATKEVGG